MTELVERLRAQLDKDERTIRAAGGEGIIAWLTYRDGQGQMRYTTVASGHGTAADPGDVWVAAGKQLPAPMSVLVVHDSARSLAEVDAKRRIVEMHTPVTLRRRAAGGEMQDILACDYDTDPDGVSWIDYPCLTLRLLALPYAGHEDYNESWRP